MLAVPEKKGRRGVGKITGMGVEVSAITSFSGLAVGRVQRLVSREGCCQCVYMRSRPCPVCWRCPYPDGVGGLVYIIRLTAIRLAVEDISGQVISTEGGWQGIAV